MAVGGRFEKLEEIGPAGAHRVEEHIFAVRSPAHCVIARPKVAGVVPGKASRHAAIGTDDVDVGQSMFEPRVGDLRAIGRVVRTFNYVVLRGQALGYAARAGHGPDIVGIQEGDLRLAERGIAQQQMDQRPRRGR